MSREQILIEHVGMLEDMSFGRELLVPLEELEAAGERPGDEHGIYSIGKGGPPEALDVYVRIDGAAEGRHFPKELDFISISYPNDEDGDLTVELKNLPKKPKIYIEREGKGMGDVRAIVAGDNDVEVVREGEGEGSAYCIASNGTAIRKEEGMGDAVYIGPSGEAVKDGEGAGNAFAVATSLEGKVVAHNKGEGPGIAALDGEGSPECVAMRTGGPGDAICHSAQGKAIKEEGYLGKAIHTKGGEAIMQPAEQMPTMEQAQGPKL